MIVSDIITRVRRTFGDEAAVQVDDADIIRWINDGQVEIVKHNDEVLQKSATVNLVANQATYTLPVDLLMLRSLRYKYSDMDSYLKLRYKNMQQFDEEIDGWDGTVFPSNAPQFFTMDEGKAILFPTPDQSSVSGLKVIYNQKPTDVVTNSDTPSLPLLYHTTLVKYCMWQASLLDEDHEPALVYQSNFKDDVDTQRGKETANPVASYSTITVLADDL